MADNYRNFNTISVNSGPLKRKINPISSFKGPIKRKFNILGVNTNSQNISSNTVILNSTQQNISSSANIGLFNIRQSILTNAFINLSGRQSINSSANIEVDGIQNNILSDAFINYGNFEQSLLSDTIIKYIQIQTINADSTIAASYQSKFIHNTDLFIATTNTSGNIIKANISPSIPTWTIYTGISGLINAQNLVINFSTHYLYIACANGIIIKSSLTSPTIVSSLYAGEGVSLIPIAHLSDYRYTYAASDNATGTLYMFEETEEAIINCDFRFLKQLSKVYKNFISFLKGKLINLDLRFAKIINTIILSDLRFLKSDYNTLQPLSRSAFVVKINGVQNDFVKLDSININLTVDTQAIATFTMARYHDKLDYDLNGNYAPITANNAIDIFINNNLIFSGKVSALRASSQTDDVTVTAESDYPAFPPESVATSSIVLDRTLKQLPLTILNHKTGLYDLLLDEISIEAPDIDTNDQNPSIWKGIKAQLGNWEIESVYREDAKYTFGNAEDFENFVPEQNYEYFWYASGTNFIDGFLFDFKYIGTSLAPLSNDTFDIQEFSFKKQRKFPNIVKSSYIATSYSTVALGIGTKTFLTQYGLAYNAGMPVIITNALDQAEYMEGTVISYNNFYLVVNVTASFGSGTKNSWTILPTERIASYYYVGEAPFKEVSIKNGLYISYPYWEDREDGLYEVQGSTYDFRPYVKLVAQNEYIKMCNINGAVLPITQANMTITIDAYFYYGLRLLNRINLIDTTQAGIYKNSNGFPISIKAIIIDSKSMSVSLTCDNQWSRTELDALDDALPPEPHVFSPVATKIEDKFDINLREDIT